MPRPPKDSLAEINGVKPDVLLQDGEEKPVMSKTTGLYVYRVKRMGPYYHCTCPAWKNQQKPNTSRTCRHMKYLFGEDYEKERIAREENGDDDEDNMDVDGAALLLFQNHSAKILTLVFRRTRPILTGLSLMNGSKTERLAMSNPRPVVPRPCIK
ncbi:hypothetical protein BKA70DRAFT_292850 [Coprinopsis sp. MPI-PUGE-AT-0042]|nr:hypothetical protein BKA70DRAFT_292850 [Coprinopsis sp. MPI-PUGE-AT-0042]